MKENITREYKKADNTIIQETNFEAKKITEKLHIEDRVEILQSTEAFISIKDHKQIFQNQPQCRLLNPAKSEIGRISQKILQQVNTSIREKLGLKQWINSEDAIKWFESIDNKSEKEFI